MLDRGYVTRLVGTMLGAYRLEQLAEWDELGPVFLARNAQDAAFRIRVLPHPREFGPDQIAAYLDEFNRFAQQLVALRHPYLLPVTAFGSVPGLSYLVSPQLSARSLTTRLRQSGPVDVITAGRYLDQAAAALEHLHEHATLHGHLTPDSMLLQLDGQVVIADFGVRQLLELGERPGPATALRYVQGSAAPEQLLGGALDCATDVYALGGSLYLLLSGHPMYSGSTREAVAQQHLHAPVPSLAARRPGLPPGLDAVLARAVAKQPSERFQTPGALADAYQRVVSPNNATRVPFAVSQSAAVRGPRAPSSGHPTGRLGRGDEYGAMDALAASRIAPRPASAPGQQAPGKTPWWRIGVFSVVLIAVVAAGLFGLRMATSSAPSVPPSGEVLFTASPNAPIGQTDTLRLRVRDLPAPPGGSAYYAWMIEPQTEQVTPLGPLTLDRGTYTLSYTATAGAAGADANLLALGSMITVTLETGKASVPSGQLMLSGTFPAQPYVHIKHVLTAFPTTPGRIGLAVGMLRQLQLLAAHVEALQQAATAANQTNVSCEAQRVINILEGTAGAHYRQLPPPCAAPDPGSSGDGFGLLGTKTDGTGGGYISNAAQHASLAATQPDATDQMHTYAAKMATATANARLWALNLRQDAVALLKNPADTGKIAEMVTLARNALNGADTNSDGNPDQPGALVAFSEAQQMATLTLTPPKQSQ